MTLPPAVAHSTAPQALRLLQRLGLISGGLAGLAVSAGAWSLEAASAVTAHMAWILPSLVAGMVLVCLLVSLAGWLTARADSAWAGGLIWLPAALLVTVIVGYLPYTGRTLTIWLIDPSFWGLPIYVIDATAQARMLAGFFLALCFAFVGITQPDRLESGLAALTPTGRLTGQAVFIVGWPLLFAFAIGWLMDGYINQPLRDPARTLNTAIQVARDYPGDLIAYGRQQGLNYGALTPVRYQLGDRYTLMISDIEMNIGAGQTVEVTAEFDNGAWVNCRSFADELSFCEDARPPYFQSFPALLAGDTADDLQTSDAWRGWLQKHGAKLGPAPRVRRLAQWGSYVLMRAEAPDSGAAVECLFSGIKPVQLERCADAAP